MSLLIGQEMIQHEHLRAVLLCESDRSAISGIAGLCETVGAAGQFLKPGDCCSQAEAAEPARDPIWSKQRSGLSLR